MNRGYFVYLYIAGQPDSSLIDCTILLNDIDLSNAGGTTSYTFGNPNITFNGTIDFNGKTITKDTYSLTTKREVTSYIFYKLGAEADLKNIVIDYSLNSVSPKMTVTVVGDKIVEVPAAKEDGYYSLFLYNEGSIDNVIVRLKKATQKARANVALLGYDNSGKTCNFARKNERKQHGYLHDSNRRFSPVRVCW